jgi:hypothetical protein
MPRRRAYRSLLPFLALSFGIVPACKCSQDSPVGASATGSASASASVSSAPSASASAGAEEDEVRPVYPVLTGPPDPLAVKVCGVVQSNLEARTHACCGRPASKSGLEKECERVVSGALADKSVTVSEEQLAACTKAIDETFVGCDWVRPFSTPSLPPACTELFTGQRPARARCRSHLECATGLFCDGLSPTRVGTCASPRKAGGCFGGTDALATLAHQRTEGPHAACEGVCVGRQCRPATAVGAACKQSVECGPDNHCEGGKCQAGKPTDCSACAYGTACLDGACKPPKKDGEACTKSEECRGSCVKPKGAKAGTCTMQCALTLPGLK